MFLIKMNNFEHYYTCKRKPKPSQGCSAAAAVADNDYTCKQFNTNEY